MTAPNRLKVVEITLLYDDGSGRRITMYQPTSAGREWRHDGFQQFTVMGKDLRETVRIELTTTVEEQTR